MKLKNITFFVIYAVWVCAISTSQPRWIHYAPWLKLAVIFLASVPVAFYIANLAPKIGQRAIRAWIPTTTFVCAILWWGVYATSPTASNWDTVPVVMLCAAGIAVSLLGLTELMRRVGIVRPKVLFVLAMFASLVSFFGALLLSSGSIPK